MEATMSRPEMSLTAARRLAGAALGGAAHEGVQIEVVVVEPGNQLLLLVDRMTARRPAVPLARSKADREAAIRAAVALMRCSARPGPSRWSERFCCSRVRPQAT